MCICRTSTVVCLILTVFAAGSVHASDPIRLGVSIALSGRYAKFGAMYADGLRLWTTKQNAKGGILGRPVDLTIHDDKSDADNAVKIYREMLSSGRFDFVFGPYSSPISKSVLPLLDQYHYPTLIPLAAVESVWDSAPRYAFGVSIPERRWTKSLFTLMADRNVDKLVIVVDQALMDLGTPREMLKWAKRFGLKVLSHEQLDRPNLATQLRRLQNTGAQALLMWGYFDETVTVKRTLAEVGWTPRLFFSQVAPALDEYGKVLGDLANYTLGSGVWDPEVSRAFPGGIDFMNSFREEYKCVPSYHAASGYAAGVILAEAISRAGDTDREKVRDILSSLDTVTLVGRYGVDEKGIQIRQHPIIYQWQNGHRKVIWPESLSTATLQFPPETGQ